MKTNYHQRNKAGATKWRIAIVVIVVFVIVFYLLSLIKLPLVSIASPFWKAENKTTQSLANVFSFLRSKNDLVRENQELKLIIQSREAEHMAYTDWRTREVELFDLLGRKGEGGGVMASVIAHPPQSPYDVLIVDVGTSDGVIVGDRARMPEGPLLGVVAEVSSGNSKVRLFSSSGNEINAVLERNNVSVTLVGSGGGMFTLSLPRDVEVEPGDRILSADMSAGFLAIVGDVSLKPTDSFKIVKAKGPTNIFNTRFVLITQ